MKRREFIRLLGGVAATQPIAAHAQQPALGYLESGTPAEIDLSVQAFRKGLSETGYVEGQNLAIEYRFARGRYDELPAMAADLVRRQVAVIVATGSANSARAAKAATSTIPIVFANGGDPVALGLVASMNRPGGNATGVSFLIAQLAAKRLELLRELVPGLARVAVLANPNNPATPANVDELKTAGAHLQISIAVLLASSAEEIDAAFLRAAQEQCQALLNIVDVFLFTRRAQIVALAARYAIAGMGSVREFTEAGGLASYGSNVADSYRQAGVYAGRILKGAKPADLPVIQPTKFQLVINLKTAKALGLQIPDKLLALADEVIE
jgi:putative ABC transport system substrate-binding protein